MSKASRSRRGARAAKWRMLPHLLVRAAGALESCGTIKVHAGWGCAFVRSGCALAVGPQSASAGKRLVCAQGLVSAGAAYVHTHAAGKQSALHATSTHAFMHAARVYAPHIEHRAEPCAGHDVGARQGVQDWPLLLIDQHEPGLDTWQQCSRSAGLQRQVHRIACMPRARATRATHSCS